VRLIPSSRKYGYRWVFQLVRPGRWSRQAQCIARNPGRQVLSHLFSAFFSGFPQTSRRPAQRERLPGFMSRKRAATQRIETMGGNQRPGLVVSWVT
jgi:hypothetical protein